MHPCSTPSKSAAPSVTTVIPITSVAVPIAVEEARVKIQTAADAAQAAAEGQTALRLSDGVVMDAAIRYQLVRAYPRVPKAAQRRASIVGRPLGPDRLC